MANKTQMELYKELDDAYTIFLVSSVKIRHEISCESKIHTLIEDMENANLDYLAEILISARDIDDTREYEAAHPEKQYDKYGD